MRRKPWQGIVVAAPLTLLFACAKEPAKQAATSTDQTAETSVASSDAAAPYAPVKLDVKHLPNAYRLHEKVLSGGQPEGDEAYAELAALGVKTVISVDGAKPDIQAAKRFGLRYVHMPHGYDGIPEARAQELAKAVRDLPGPIYIHCHHGKHRSPAAATVACVEVGFLQPQDALTVLKTAGTSENYRGLYQSAESARRLEAALLDELQVDYPETVQLPPMAEAMVAIEHTFGHLKTVSTAEWRPTAAHPDIDPPHEALMLAEHFAELLRTDETKVNGETFAKYLQESEAASLSLETALRSIPPDLEGATAAFATVTKNCTACHQAFRDVPLGEKAGR